MSLSLVLAVTATAALSSGPVTFSPAKITATGADGSTREFVASDTGAVSFEQFASARTGGDFGFAVDCQTALNPYPYPCRVIIVGPSTELRIATDQSVAHWRFLGAHRVQVCSAALHGAQTQTCRVYALPE